MTAKELREVAFAVQYNKIIDSLFLNDKQKTLMDLRYIKGLLYKEIADKLNCSEQTIKKEFLRINLKLKAFNMELL